MFGSSSDQSLNIIVRLQDEASKALNDLESKISKFSKSIEPAAAASRKFALGLTAVATAVGGFGIMALRSAADAEQTRIAFETMLGSTEKAGTFIKDLVAFAAKTPFELKGLEQSSKQLLAYGFAQEEVLPNLKALGDIASGVGMDKLPNLIMAFGQVRAATRLTGMELRQFTEAGVPLLQALSDQLGKPVAEIQKMVSAGQIGFPMVQKALEDMTKEGGKFNDLMDKQSKSLGGMWSNLQDAWEQFLRGEGAQLIEWGKQFVAFLIDLVQNHLPKWIAKIKEITDWLGKNKPVIYAISGAILGALVPAVAAATAAFIAWGIALAPFLIGGAIIGLLIGAIVWIVKNWDMLKEKARQVWSWIKDHIEGILLVLLGPIGLFIDAIIEIVKHWEEIKEAAAKIWNAIKDFFSKLWEDIKNVFKFAVAFIAGLVITIFDALGIDIVGVFHTIRDFFINIWQEIKDTFNQKLNELKEGWNAIWTAIGDFLGPIWDGIKAAVMAGWNWLVEKFKAFTKPISDAWNGMWDGLTTGVRAAWETVKTVVKDSINWMIEKVNVLINAINKVASKGAGAIGFTAPQIQNIPLLANGGIVNKPTLAMVGEAGPEAVIPLSEMGKMGGGGINVTINYPEFKDLDDENKMRKMLDDYFRPLLINNKISA